MKKIWVYLVFLSIFFLVTFLNLFPNYYAEVKTPQNYFYSGQASWFDPWDINVYTAAIKWGQKGHFLLENLYTTEMNKPALIYPLYTLVGNSFPKVNPFLLFHLLSIFSGAVLVVGVFYLSSFFLNSQRDKFVSLILIILGGGLGVFFFPQITSNDLFMTSFTFQSGLQRPHEAVGTLLYLAAMVFYFAGTTKNKPIFYLFSFLSLSLLIIFYPIYLLSFTVICSIFTLFNKVKKNFIYLGSISIIVGILTLTYLIHLQSSGFASVVSQSLNNLGLVSLVFGYGIFLPLFIYQLFHLKKQEKGRLFLNLWFISSFFLSFLPFGFARFYLRSLFFPLGILTVLALNQLSKNYTLQKFSLYLLFIIFTSFSSFFILYKRIDEVGKNNPWFYMPTQVQKGLQYLKTEKKDGVLSSYLLGNYIPANTGKRVYLGHLIQTPAASDKVFNLNNFYAGKFKENEALQFLKNNLINLVVYSDEEKKIGRLNYRFLQRIYQNEKIEIFSVNP